MPTFNCTLLSVVAQADPLCSSFQFCLTLKRMLGLSLQAAGLPGA